LGVGSLPDEARLYLEEAKTLGLPEGAQPLKWTSTQWRRDHNSRHMAVPEKVIDDCELADADAKTWLTPTQVQSLRAVLDQDPPSGPWSLKVMRHGGYATVAVIDVNGSPVRLNPGRDELMPRLADPLPALLVIAAFWAIIDGSEIGNHVPLARAVVPAIAYVGAAVFADEIYRRRGDEASVAIALTCSGIACVQAAIAGLETRRSPFSPGGTRRVPMQHASIAPTLAWSYIAGRRDSRAAPAAAGLGLVAAFVGSVVGQRQPRDVRANLARWPANFAAAIAGYVYGREQHRWNEVARRWANHRVEAARRGVAAQAAAHEWTRIVSTAEALRSTLRGADLDDVDLKTNEAKVNVVIRTARVDGKDQIADHAPMTAEGS
jgi:hypothetical protein